MNYQKNTHEPKYGIKNNASLEEIENFSWFQKISHYIDENNLSNYNVFHAIENDTGIQAATREWSFLWMDINTLKSLKQAINNQICLGAYENFLKDSAHISQHNLPITTKNEALNDLGFESISPEDFIKWAHPNLKKIAAASDGWDLKPHNISFIEAQQNKILSPVFRLLLTQSEKRTVIHNYLLLFEKNIHIYYMNLLSRRSIESRNKETIVYYFLEYFFQFYSQYKGGVNWNSYPCSIWFWSNIPHLLKYIQKSEEDKSLNCDYNSISQFLKNQTKETMKSINDREKTLTRNRGGESFNTSRKVFEVLGSLQNEDDSWAYEESLGWCPFAKSKTNDWKPALLDMYNTFDNYFLLIIQELEKQWYTK